jgi:stage II sporulation protein D
MRPSAIPRALAALALTALLAGCAEEPVASPPAAMAASAAGGQSLRVLIASGGRALKMAAPGGLRLEDAQGRALYEIPAGGHASLKVAEGRLWAQGTDLGARKAWVKPRREGEAIMVSGHRYRGELTLLVDRESRPRLVNRVGLEAYLMGVLAAEVPPDWPLEALKAQAIAARTYALYRAAHPDKGAEAWDLDDTTSSQVYAGQAREDPRTDRAVADTRGQVLLWKGELAQTFFHSNCGGRTADVSKVWGGDVPYLRGVACPYCRNDKHYAWQAELGLAKAGQALKDAGLCPSAELRGLEGVDPDLSGRFYQVRIIHGMGESLAKATALRAALGADVVRSTRFEADISHGMLRLRGKGWGHGIGLCQEGARGMAEDGYPSRLILDFYFPGTQLARLR